MNCSRFGFLVTSLFVITSLFRRRVLCMQYFGWSGFFGSTLTHHVPKDLGLICLVKQRKIRFRILLDFRIHSWIFLEKRTLRRYRGFKFALWRRYVFRFASVQFCFQNLPCNPPPTTPPLIKKWNGPSKSIVFSLTLSSKLAQVWGRGLRRVNGVWLRTLTLR